MNRRTIRFLLLLAVLVPALLVAADAFEQYSIDRVQVENSLLGALRGWYGAPDLMTLKELPPAERAAAVHALGGALKAYVASPGFQKEYAKAYKNSKPKGSGLLGSLSTRSLIEKGVDRAMGKQPEVDKRALDKDPNVTLRRRLQAFLDATADVDFAAKTTGAGSSRRFEDKAYEAKPPEWKMCYRAGREAAEAARAFAKGWLEELTPAR